jgi:hypothetical protein
MKDKIGHVLEVGFAGIIGCAILEALTTWNWWGARLGQAGVVVVTATAIKRIIEK